MAEGIGNLDERELPAAMAVFGLIPSQRYAKKIKIPKQRYKKKVRTSVYYYYIDCESIAPVYSLQHNLN